MLYDFILRVEKLSHRCQKKSIFRLMLVGSLIGLFEALGVVIIIPFLTLLDGSSLPDNQTFISTFIQFAHNIGLGEQLLSTGILTVILLFLVGTVKILLGYTLNSFVEDYRASMSTKLYSNYLNQDYIELITSSANEKQSKILLHIDQFIHWGIKPLATLSTYATTAILVCVILIVSSPEAMAIVPAFALFYGLIFFLIRKSLFKKGVEKDEINLQKNKLIVDAFGGIIDVKIKNQEHYYTSKFEFQNFKFSKIMKFINSLAIIPNNLIEIFAFSLIILLSLYLSFIGSEEFVSVMGLFAFSAYRLKPAAQQIFQSFSNLRFAKGLLNQIGSDFEIDQTPSKEQNTASEKSNLKFSNFIEFKGVSYNFENTNNSALTDINLKIEKGETVGFFGASGSGKTTLLLLLAGLLEPFDGQISIDGELLNSDNRLLWREKISYLGQKNYFVDDTVIANIVFDDEVEPDISKIKEVSKVANIYDFVNGELPQKFDTIIGDNGSKLSGGQLQRLALARSLYTKKDIYIFDESSSALDEQNQEKISKSVCSLLEDDTVFIIAHRLNALRYCDRIFELNNGKLVAEYTFDKLGQKVFLDEMQKGDV